MPQGLDGERGRGHRRRRASEPVADPTWAAAYRRAVDGTFLVGSFPSGRSPYGALPEFGLRFRVVRGGDWYLDRIYHQTASRLRAPANHRVPTIGFRCACGHLRDRHGVE